MSWKQTMAAVAAALCVLIPAASAAGSKPVLAYYRAWYAAKPHSPEWGWHWTMNHFDPDQVDASGQREIASWYRPLIGPYDSADPVVLEYHVLLMKLAGIDGLIVNWYGQSPHFDFEANNQRTFAVFKQAQKAGLSFVLCYEDASIPQLINGGHLRAENAVEHAQHTMLYAQSNYFAAPSYMRIDGRPVLLNFGPRYFNDDGQWQAIFSVLAPTNRPAFFTEDDKLGMGQGAFNWPPMWLSLAPGTRGVLSSAALDNYLVRFEEKAAKWPAFISSAFPRFHDIYQKAGVRDYLGYLGDRNGATFRPTLTRALTNDSSFVQLVTWNDYGEGTMIEPTVEYGFRDLGIVQEQRRLHLDPNFAFTTNDLALPFVLYQLRREAGTNAAVQTELDRVASEVISGNLAAARESIERLQSASPAR